MAAGTDVISLRDVRTCFHPDEGVLKALDGLSCRVGMHETLGLIGESGCGKSITAQSTLRIEAYPHELSGALRRRAMIGMALSCIGATSTHTALAAGRVDLHEVLSGLRGVAERMEWWCVSFCFCATTEREGRTAIPHLRRSLGEASP